MSDNASETKTTTCGPADANGAHTGSGAADPVQAPFDSSARGRPPHDDPQRQADRKLLGDLVKKAVTTGINTMLTTEEGVRAVVGAVAEKDLIGSAVSGVDATRREAVAIVGREVHNFLETLNLSEEITKILTSVSFEIRTEVRFIPNEEGKLRAKVSSGARPRVKINDVPVEEDEVEEELEAVDDDDAKSDPTTRRGARRAVRGIVERLAEATAATARAAAEVAAETAADVVNEARGHAEDE